MERSLLDTDVNQAIQFGGRLYVALSGIAKSQGNIALICLLQAGYQLSMRSLCRVQLLSTSNSDYQAVE